MAGMLEGFVHVNGPFAEPEQAWTAARALIDSSTAGEHPLEVIGEFVIPPLGGPSSRDFQTLHFDFGLPLAPAAPGDVARFTALHVGADTVPGKAETRLVPLRTLVCGRTWPESDELVRRFRAYGESHGAWEGSEGYVEGSLARLIEAALDRPPALPSVREQPGFLC